MLAGPVTACMFPCHGAKGFGVCHRVSPAQLTCAGGAHTMDMRGHSAVASASCCALGALGTLLLSFQALSISVPFCVWPPTSCCGQWSVMEAEGPVPVCVLLARPEASVLPGWQKDPSGKGSELGPCCRAWGEGTQCPGLAPETHHPCSCCLVPSTMALSPPR